MNKAFGIWVILVALAISAVAAYYSIVGLAAIFSASLIPVIIMGSVLEVGKITSAVWLHVHWERAASILKLYLCIATAVLMLITSMGIFGFLSKAHIEQNADSAIVAAQMESIDSRIAIERESIGRSESRIEQNSRQAERIRDSESESADSKGTVAESIMESNRASRAEIAEINERLAALRQGMANAESGIAILDTGSVREIQKLAGVRVDGVMGSKTAAAVESLRRELNSRVERDGEEANELAERRDSLQAEIDARNAEIERVLLAERENEANVRNDGMLDRIGSEIADAELAIKESFGNIEKLETEKADLNRQMKLFEVEVGPVKYIAEMIYGETDSDILERAVRWVILTLVFVFDPLAVALVLAGVSVFRMKDGKRPAVRRSPIMHQSSHVADSAQETAPESEETPMIGEDSAMDADAPENEPVEHADEVETAGFIGESMESFAENPGPVDSSQKISKFKIEDGQLRAGDS